jgi:hypothetical protein
MDEPSLLRGYRRLLAEVYSEDAYFRRCARLLDVAPALPAPLRPGAVATFVRTAWRLGVIGKRRRSFWRLLARGLRRGGLAALPRAVTLSILGEHLLRYTAEEVLPRLDRLIAEPAGRAAAATPRPPSAAEASPAAPRSPPYPAPA